MAVLLIASLLAFPCRAAGEADSLRVQGRVKSKITKQDLTEAIVVRYDNAGRAIDSIRCNQGVFVIDGEYIHMSIFSFYVAHRDTTDAIWNARLTYTPRGGRFVIMADAFDLLHQLSNVNYAVNAQGRTITWSNTLPRYVLLSVQFRFNKQPRRR